MAPAWSVHPSPVAFTRLEARVAMRDEVGVVDALAWPDLTEAEM
jgi:hypothetical protein